MIHLMVREIFFTFQFCPLVCPNAYKSEACVYVEDHELERWQELNELYRV